MILVFSQAVAAEDFDGKWQVCDVLNLTSEGCDGWWLNATESYNFTVGNFVVFDINNVPDFSGFDIADGDVFIVESANNFTIFNAKNFTVYAGGNFTIIASSNFTIAHVDAEVLDLDLSSYINRSEFDSLVESKLSVKNYALADNVVDNNMIADYMKTNTFANAWDDKLTKSLDFNGTIWSAINDQVPEQDSLLWLKVLAFVNLFSIIVIGALLWRIYTE